MIDWTGSRPRLVELAVGVDDDQVASIVAGLAKLGIDSPLGWPEPFVDFVTQHRSGQVHESWDVESPAGRDLLSFRDTDRFVKEQFGVSPLSVSADKLGRVAMRTAGLLARLARLGLVLDRSGVDGLVVEVYPAVSLRQWGLAHRGRSKPDALRSLCADLQQRAPWLDVRDHSTLCASSDHAFDAVIAGLAARAVALGLSTPPSDDQTAQARLEGWIHVPTAALGDLVTG